MTGRHPDPARVGPWPQERWCPRGAPDRRGRMANASKGLFVWYEHLTRDVQGAVAFYSDVVGWKTQPFGQGSDYTMWVGSQGPLGGVMRLPESGAIDSPPERRDCVLSKSLPIYVPVEFSPYHQQ